MSHPLSSTRPESIAGAIGGLALGLAIALAANLTYAAPRGPVVIGLGLIAPLVLPVVLWLRTIFDADGFWPKLLRELATLAVAGPAVAVSYVHTYSLVLGAGEPWILAFLAPLSSDGLAGMATLALHRNRVAAQRTPVQEPAPISTPAPPPPPAVEPIPEAQPSPPATKPEPEVAATPWPYDKAVAWATVEDAGAKRIQAHCGLSEHHAKNARRDAIAARALRIAR